MSLYFHTALLVAIALIGFLPILKCIGHLKLSARVRRIQCAHCAYSMQGGGRASCPECGCDTDRILAEACVVEKDIRRTRPLRWCLLLPSLAVIVFLAVDRQEYSVKSCWGAREVSTPAKMNELTTICVDKILFDYRSSWFNLSIFGSTFAQFTFSYGAYDSFVTETLDTEISSVKSAFLMSPRRYWEAFGFVPKERWDMLLIAENSSVNFDLLHESILGRELLDTEVGDWVQLRHRQLLPEYRVGSYFMFQYLCVIAMSVASKVYIFLKFDY